ncbi:MAG TPA: hypothetical protein EYO01_07145 [Phycisphaerales bacterium]|jgi:hypothetical protein|nr:hypothetical protein [Phycisphaerales bacterium]HIB49788.1 hypothetical protein [Phycisphaerales bacterium]HIN84729.1 hypothetical protein [Phycisphaerales bacterium]HIO19813.1 hypothetical protein [Phycisphaerales bacterium]
MHIETPIFEQNTGFAFDSNDFAMTFPSTGTILPAVGTATKENWDDDEDDDEDENTIVEVEIDSDLEDGDDEDSRTNKGKDDEKSEDVSDDDDEFEHYLFGENDD